MTRNLPANTPDTDITFEVADVTDDEGNGAADQAKVVLVGSGEVSATLKDVVPSADNKSLRGTFTEHYGAPGNGGVAVNIEDADGAILATGATNYLLHAGKVSHVGEVKLTSPFDEAEAVHQPPVQSGPTAAEAAEIAANAAAGLGPITNAQRDAAGAAQPAPPASTPPETAPTTPSTPPETVAPAPDISEPSTPSTSPETPVASEPSTAPTAVDQVPTSTPADNPVSTPVDTTAAPSTAPTEPPAIAGASPAGSDAVVSDAPLGIGASEGTTEGIPGAEKLGT